MCGIIGAVFQAARLKLAEGQVSIEVHQV